MKRYLKIFTQKRDVFIALFITSLIFNILMLVPTLYMLQVYDRILVNPNEYTLIALTLIAVFLYGLMSAADHIRNKFLQVIARTLSNRFKPQIFKISLQNNISNKSDSILDHNNDLNILNQWLNGTNVGAFLDFPWIPIYLTLMFLIHPILGWITIVFLLNLVAITALQIKFIDPLKNNNRIENLAINEFTHKKLQNAEVIDSLGMSHSLKSVWTEKHESRLYNYARLNSLENFFQISTKQLRTLKQSLSLGISAYLVIHGEMSVGAMIATTTLMARATAPAEGLITGWSGFIESKNAFLNLLNLNANLEKIKKSSQFNNSDSILFDKFSALTQDGKKIIYIPNMDLPPQKIYIITGESGIGKSTLLKSIAGIWPNFTGTITLPTEENTDPTIGYLNQEPDLYDDTIMANITQLDEHPDIDSLIEAAKFANIHSVITKLPENYSTQLNYHQAPLSGGQLQQIALARAFYKQPKFIFLDEPDAHLDQKSKEALYQNIMLLKKDGSTIFVVSHDSEILKVADQIININRQGITLHENIS